MDTTTNSTAAAMPQLFDLTGHVALVTGGNGGLGIGMARGTFRRARQHAGDHVPTADALCGEHMRDPGCGSAQIFEVGDINWE